MIGDTLARIPYIDDAIIPQALGLKENIYLLRIVYQSPQLGEAFGYFAAARPTGLALSPKVQELLILHTAWHTHSECVWTSHQAIARSAGVTDAQMAAIQQDQIQAFVFNAKEKKLLQMLSHIAESQSLPRNHFDEARKHFSDRELVEIVSLQGFYYTVATLASVFELEIVRHWEKAHRYREILIETPITVYLARNHALLVGGNDSGKKQ